MNSSLRSNLMMGTGIEYHLIHKKRRDGDHHLRADSNGMAEDSSLCGQQLARSLVVFVFYEKWEHWELSLEEQFACEPTLTALSDQLKTFA